jgi:predicted dehydrogenase
MSETRYRVALIGAGHRAGRHALAYQHLPEATVCACAEPVEERRDAFAARHQITGYADAAEMITREQPDLVHVVTPPSVRVDVLTLVAELGVPAATVEKPVAEGVDDWRALCALAARARTKIGVCHQFRWQADLARCRDAVLSGELGRVLYLEATAGMNVTNQGTHALHYGNSLHGDLPVSQVFGAAAGWEAEDLTHPGPESTLGRLTFADGTQMLWATGPTTPRVGDPTTTWQHVRVAAYCERGRVLWEEFGRWEIVGPGRDERGDYGGMDTWLERNLEAQAAFHRDMLTWIDHDDRPAGTHLERSLHEWQAVLALYASAVERRPVAMAEFDPPGDLMRRLATAVGRA